MRKSRARVELERLLDDATDPAARADLASRLATVTENESRAAARRRRAKRDKPKPAPQPIDDSDQIFRLCSCPLDQPCTCPPPEPQAPPAAPAVVVPAPPPEPTPPVDERPVSPFSAHHGHGETRTYPAGTPPVVWSYELGQYVETLDAPPSCGPHLGHLTDVLFGPPATVQVDTWTAERGLQSEWDRNQREAEEAYQRDMQRKLYGR